MPGRALMVQGCSSSTGKSYLTTALCRIYARQGFKVAPFKAQNMSNNAGVTKGGLELSRAQLLQAQAARVVPDVRMNPVLVKPEGDTRSQVVVLGKRDADISRLPWTERKAYLWPTVQASLHSLLEDFELVVIEGAGSPAEINLKAGDIVNMRVAQEAQARVLLAADIDRGGAFAHLLGTWGCLDKRERATLLGFVLNKFRGDPKLLGNGMEWLETQTGVPTLGVVPYRPLDLPEEDAHGLGEGRGKRGDGVEVAVIHFPTLSNFDEFAALAAEPQVSLRWATTPDALADVSLIILPGSKHVAADRRWLRESGLADTLLEAARTGTAILGVCGGMQLLGRELADPHGVEGGGLSEGLGLLDLTTTLEPEKTTRQTRTTLLPTGEPVHGYEIHNGRSVPGPGATPFLDGGLGFRQGNVTGVYPHGLFEDTAFRRFVLGELGVGSTESTWAAGLEATLDTLADHVEAHLDMTMIDAALTGSAPKPPRPRLILITGGARSGKSRYAEALVRHFLTGSETALYLATLEAGDEEMASRIARHRTQRPKEWRTVETPLEPARAVSESPERVVLIDCLSGYVSNLLLRDETVTGDVATDMVLRAVETLLDTVRSSDKTVVVVTNEVGGGVVPAYPLGRLYRDALGLANARVAAAADAVVLCTVGLHQTLKGTLPEVSYEV